MKERNRDRVTEQRNPACDLLDTQTPQQILAIMNREDEKVASAVKRAIPQIARAVDLATQAMTKGGRLVYMGSGTSGRLGVLDAAECLPTFGSKKVVAVLSGGHKGVSRSVEGVEDDRKRGQKDLQQIKFSKKDVLVGLSASGRTPYTLAGMTYARRIGAKTVAVTSNPEAPLKRSANVPIVVVVGPEVVAGSTRLKAGTAQKLVLNMLSTATMIRLGKVLSGWMIHVQLKNQKLWQRGRSILAKAAGVDRQTAARTLAASGGNLPAALLMVWSNLSRKEAVRLLGEYPNTAALLRKARRQFLRAGHLRPTPRRKQRRMKFRSQP